MTQIERAFDGATLIAILVAAPLCLGLLMMRRRQRAPMARSLSEALLLISVVAVLAVTLLPAVGPPERSVEWIPFTDLTSSARRTQVVLNLALLFPTGILLVIALPTTRSLTRVLSAALGLPLLIEITQATLPLGRVASTEDLILGSTGLLLGGLSSLSVASTADRFLHRRTETDVPGARRSRLVKERAARRRSVRIRRR